MVSGALTSLKLEKNDEFVSLACYEDHHPTFGQFSLELERNCMDIIHDHHDIIISNKSEPAWSEFGGNYDYDLPNPQNNHISSSIQLDDFDKIFPEIEGFWNESKTTQVSYIDEGNNVIDVKPLSSRVLDYGSSSAQVGVALHGKECPLGEDGNRKYDKRSGRFNKSTALETEDIQKYFDMPITEAAKNLNVGLTVLKKRCRELGIMRWPHRKIKSLKSLIDNVKEMGLTKEIDMLEEHKRMLERVPEMELTERTKKLRQACFKANYKKKIFLQKALS